MKALENDYDYYVRGKISLLDDPDYIEYEKYHYVAGYDGNMETGAYKNTLYFFYPDGTSDFIDFIPWSMRETYTEEQTSTQKKESIEADNQYIENIGNIDNELI